MSLLTTNEPKTIDLLHETMHYKTIDEIYEGNSKIREQLKNLLAEVKAENLSALRDGEKWTVAQIVEHIAMVDEGTVRICAKLLRKAKDAGRTGDGKVTISDQFLKKGSELSDVKVEAPAFVRPTGEQTLADSLARLDATETQAAKLRELFRTVDSSEFKFPHPFFGDISAQEWLLLKGSHEMRHIRQIEELLARIKQKGSGHEEGLMTETLRPS